MKPALLWLIESLDEAANDLDVDETDIPLLPLTDECMAAVNDNDFQETMKILGIHKPSGIQVTCLEFIITNIITLLLSLYKINIIYNNKGNLLANTWQMASE